MECVHGWGANADFWAQISPYFPDHKLASQDIGYVKTECVLTDPPPEIMVTHSLGLVWATLNGRLPSKALIIINGFTAFKTFTPAAILEKMERNLARNPKAQMKSFWSMADITPPEVPIFNPEKLAEGLNWLKTKDITAEIAALKCPTLVLSGAKDRICPLAALEQQWSNHHMITHPEAGHALPQTHPDWVAAHIKDWLETL